MECLASRFLAVLRAESVYKSAINCPILTEASCCVSVPSSIFWSVSMTFWSRVKSNSFLKRR